MENDGQIGGADPFAAYYGKRVKIVVKDDQNFIRVREGNLKNVALGLVILEQGRDYPTLMIPIGDVRRIEVLR